MGILIFLGLFIYIVVAILIFKLTYKFVKIFNNKILNIVINGFVLSILILIPTYDIIITNILGAYYCLQESSPKTFIKKKIEYPKSIYWEDNVYPGFNEADRKLMIINYLDGEYLKKIALNGNDEKIYVYEIDKNIFKNLKYDKKYKDIYEQYVQLILKTKKVYTKQTIPKMNYTVTFNEVELHPYSSKFLYSDEIKIINNNTGELIAYNRRYMRFFYNILPDFALGNRYYVQKPLCGYQFYRNFDGEVFSNLKYMYGGDVSNKIDLNQKLYNKNTK